MVSLAHKFAYESPYIQAEAISAVHLPGLARSYGFVGTPHTVVNGKHHLGGRIQAPQLLAAIQK